MITQERREVAFWEGYGWLRLFLWFVLSGGQVRALTTVAPQAIFSSGSGDRAWVSQWCSQGSYVLSHRLGSALFYELGFHTLAQAGLALPIKSKLLASNSTFLSPRC